MGNPEDDERTVADRAKTVAEMPATPRTFSDAEATRVEAPRGLKELGAGTDVATSGDVPALRDIRAKDKEERERLAPPVPPSPPRGLMPPGPSAPTDPVGVAAFAHSSAPTAPTPFPGMDDESTRLAPKKLDAVNTGPPMKKKPRPGPPLVARPAARRALQKLRHLTSEISAVSINSKQPKRRRASRLILAVLVAFGLVATLQLYKAFSHNNAEMARPMGKKVEEPDFFDRLFKF